MDQPDQLSANDLTGPVVPALGRVGIWTGALGFGSVAKARDTAAEIEELGYGALWLAEGPRRDPFLDAATALAATTRLVVATGITNIALRHPMTTNALAAGLLDSAPDRFVLGLGVGDPAPGSDTLGVHFSRPRAAMIRYLDDIEHARSLIGSLTGAPAPAAPRVLAALGPKMAELARDRAAGAHTYLVTPEHTARAREILGAGKLLAPEQAVVPSTDRETVLRQARAHIAGKLQQPAYRTNWIRLGFTDDDFDDGGSERLLDALVVGGSPEAIRERVDQHIDAGADHVCVQVLADHPLELTQEPWRNLAPALLDPPR